MSVCNELQWRVMVDVREFMKLHDVPQALSERVTTNFVLNSPHLEPYRRWCHLARILNTYCEQVNR